MVELLVWRHAKTEPSNGRRSDHERRLLPVGEADAREVGRLVAERDIVPELVLCSDAVRARQTADLGAQAFPARPERFDLPELYDVDASQITALLPVYAGRATRVMIVGHNPALSEFVSVVAGSRTRLTTGALAVVEAHADAAAAVDASTSFALRTVIIPPRKA
ncbi:MAG: SixA phosphatase family protein [Spirochaetota bacterium]